MQTEQKAGRFSLIPSLPALPRRRLLAACALAFGLTGLAAAPGQAGTLTIESWRVDDLPLWQEEIGRAHV